MNKTLIVIGILLALGGMAFIVLPHEAHNLVIGLFVHDSGNSDHGHGLREHGTHTQHTTVSWVVIAAGSLLAVAGWKMSGRRKV